MKRCPYHSFWWHVRIYARFYWQLTAYLWKPRNWRYIYRPGTKAAAHRAVYRTWRMHRQDYA